MSFTPTAAKISMQQPRMGSSNAEFPDDAFAALDALVELAGQLPESAGMQAGAYLVHQDVTRHLLHQARLLVTEGQKPSQQPAKACGAGAEEERRATPQTATMCPEGEAMIKRSAEGVRYSVEKVAQLSPDASRYLVPGQCGNDLWDGDDADDCIAARHWHDRQLKS
jgi:hypothetical protein